MITSDELIETLRNKGLRITLARRVICGILADLQQEHPSAPDIYERALEATGGIDRSTVYRTLKELVDFDLVHHVHLGHAPPVYHLSADWKHHHIVCESCGHSTAVPIEQIRRALSVLDDEYDFVADGHHFAIVGHCRNCRQEHE